jgi:arylsulfatase A-like enzyme
LTTLGLPGFDESLHPEVERTAREIVDSFLAWIEGDAAGPFFAWLHLFDPHVRYEPPEPYRARFYSGDPTQGGGEKLSTIARFKQAPPVAQDQFAEVRDRAYPRAMYRGEIQYADDQIGRLISTMKERGLYEDTAIVVVGDHGESLGEHEIYYDHQGLYEVSIRIPFILRLPGFPRGVRISEPVGQIDLVPTLAELFDLTVETEQPLRGVSLADALRGEPSPVLEEREWLIHEAAHNAEVVLRRGAWKANFSIFGMLPRPPVLLFNLEEDPNEENNLADAHPEIIAELRPLVQRWIDRHIWNLANPKLEKAMLERLRALGYLPPDEE